MTGATAFSVHKGDAVDVLRSIPSDSIDCCVTSPPYWGLRDYGRAGQIGLEKSPDEYVERLVSVFAEVRRVLKPDGTCWVNLGDSYASQGGRQVAQSKWQVEGASDGQSGGLSRNAPSGLKPKDLVGIPWRVAFALQDDGWYLRQDIIWHKPNPMPESVRDRCTKAHEYIFLLTKSQRYFWNREAMQEAANRPEGAGNKTHKGLTAYNNGDEKMRTKVGLTEIGARDTRNRRSVWTLATMATPEAHFATYPIELPELCIRAGCPEGGLALDPFSGAGTTGLACLKNGRRYIGIELNEEYVEMSKQRARRLFPLFVEAIHAND